MYNRLQYQPIALQIHVRQRRRFWKSTVWTMLTILLKNIRYNYNKSSWTLLGSDHFGTLRQNTLPPKNLIFYFFSIKLLVYISYRL